MVRYPPKQNMHPQGHYVSALLYPNLQGKRPFSLYIKPEASSRGYELSLLTKAIELNKPNQMMVVVDVDNEEEVELYTAAGFTKLEGQNSVTAYIKET